MNIYYPYPSNAVNVSGSLYQYNATVSLYPEAHASGVLTHEMRQAASANSTNARGLTCDNGESLAGSLAEVAAYVALPDIVDYSYRISVNEFSSPDAVCKGYSVDVKESKYPNLLVAEKHLYEDWYYFCIQTLGDNLFRLNGWISGKEILALALEHPEIKCNPRNRRNSDGSPAYAYIVPRKFLHPFRRFIGKRLDSNPYQNN